MSTKNDVAGVTFNWTDEYTVIFCDVCINFITKNGRGQPFRWCDIQDQFADTIGKKCHFKSLKNKYDAMKKDWRLWKYLKTGETGLGWNSTTGKLDCSDEWWGKKLKEKPEAKKFRFKGLSPLLEEMWDHLFGDAVATGAVCVALSLSQEFVDQTFNEVEEVQDREGGTVDFSQYPDRLRSLEDQETGFFQGFMEEVGGRNISSFSQNNLTNTNGTNLTKVMKRKKRESGGSNLLRQHLKKVDERHSEIMSLIKQGTNTKRDEVTIDEVMAIMNRIVADGEVVVGGDIWCHAMLMFRDPASRKIFFKMPSDDTRLSWLEFARKQDTV